MIIHCLSITIHDSPKESFYKDIAICSSLSTTFFIVHHRSCGSIQTCKYFLTNYFYLDFHEDIYISKVENV